MASRSKTTTRDIWSLYTDVWFMRRSYKNMTRNYAYGYETQDKIECSKWITRCIQDLNHIQVPTFTDKILSVDKSEMSLSALSILDVYVDHLERQILDKQPCTISQRCISHSLRGAVTGRRKAFLLHQLESFLSKDFYHQFYTARNFDLVCSFKLRATDKPHDIPYEHSYPDDIGEDEEIDSYTKKLFDKDVMDSESISPYDLRCISFALFNPIYPADTPTKKSTEQVEP